MMRYSDDIIQVQRTRDDIIQQSFVISILDLDSSVPFVFC